MSFNLGDFSLSSLVTVEFNTFDQTGAPFTLAGGVISVYKQGSVTEVTTGVTTTLDYDSRTGWHRVVIDLSSDTTFYSRAADFFVVITTGTVNSVSWVGRCVARFSIANRSSMVAAHSGLAQSGGAGVVTLATTAPAVANIFNKCTLCVREGTGAGQIRSVAAYSSGRIVSVDAAWTTTPDSTSLVEIWPVGVIAPATGGISTSSFAAGAINAAALGANAITAAKVATDAIGAAQLAADAVTEIQNGLSTLTQTQVTGGAYDMTNATVTAAFSTAIWNALTSGMSTVGSIGKRIVDYLTGDSYVRLGAPAGASVSADIAAINSKTTNLPAAPASTTNITAASGITVSTNNDKTGYSLSVTPPTAAQIATALWTDLLASSDFSTAASIGKLLKDNIDAAISSRSSYAGGDTAGTTTLLSRLTSTRATLLDNLDAAISSRMATFSYTTPPTTAAIATAIMTDLTSGTDFNTVGSFGKLVKDYLDAAVSSRLATGSYTAPDNANIAVAATQAAAANSIVSSGTYGNSAIMTQIDVTGIGTGTIGNGITILNQQIGFVRNVLEDVGHGNAAIATAVASRASQTSVDSIPTTNPSTSDIATALLVDGPANKLKVNADHSVNAVATVDTQSIADAVVASLSQIGVTVDSGSIAAITTAIAGALASTTTIEVPTPVNGKNLLIVKGDDYKAVDGRQLSWTLTGSWPEFTGNATVEFSLRQGFAKAGSVVTATGDTRVVQVELDSAETATFKTDLQEFGVIVTLDNGDEITVVQGLCKSKLQS